MHMVYANDFVSTTYTLTLFGHEFSVYAAIYALILNLLVVAALTPLLMRMAGSRHIMKRLERRPRQS